MKKKEWVYRQVLYDVIEREKNSFTQKYLATLCNTSIGNVNHAIKPLKNLGVIEIKPKGFVVLEPKKLLLFWASIRNLQNDIVYSTFVNARVEEVEQLLPPCKFTAYSGVKFRLGKVPSDYSEVFVYGDARLIKRRFPPKEGKPNLFVLKMDKHLESLKDIPLAQLFVDLWNINTWYAKEFLKVVEGEIDGILERRGYG